jgi:hypothetical protein
VGSIEIEGDGHDPLVLKPVDRARPVLDFDTSVRRRRPNPDDLNDLVACVNHGLGPALVARPGAEPVEESVADAAGAPERGRAISASVARSESDLRVFFEDIGTEPCRDGGFPYITVPDRYLDGSSLSNTASINSTFSCDIAYSRSPAALRASAWLR